MLNWLIYGLAAFTFLAFVAIECSPIMTNNQTTETDIHSMGDREPIMNVNEKSMGTLKHVLLNCDVHYFFNDVQSNVDDGENDDEDCDNDDKSEDEDDKDKNEDGDDVKRLEASRDEPKVADALTDEAKRLTPIAYKPKVTGKPDGGKNRLMKITNKIKDSKTPANERDRVAAATEQPDKEAEDDKS